MKAIKDAAKITYITEPVTCSLMILKLLQFRFYRKSRKEVIVLVKCQFFTKTKKLRMHTCTFINRTNIYLVQGSSVLISESIHVINLFLLFLQK